jgi:hypothetical protein
MYEFKTHEFTSSGHPPQWLRTVPTLSVIMKNTYLELLYGITELKLLEALGYSY